MNRTELESKIADFVLGKKIEGIISAVLPSEMTNSSRYVVSTNTEALDVHVPTIENHDPIFYKSYTYHPPLERGNQLSTRAKRIRPWIDGQR